MNIWGRMTNCAYLCHHCIVDTGHSGHWSGMNQSSSAEEEMNLQNWVLMTARLILSGKIEWLDKICSSRLQRPINSLMIKYWFETLLTCSKSLSCVASSRTKFVFSCVSDCWVKLLVMRLEWLESRISDQAAWERSPGWRSLVSPPWLARCSLSCGWLLPEEHDWEMVH